MFTLKGEMNKVHAAFSSGKRFNIQYLTLIYDQSRMHIQETGARYCQFTWESNRGTDGKNHVSVVDTTKEDLDKQIEHYALMLPYNNLRRSSNVSSLLYTLIGMF